VWAYLARDRKSPAAKYRLLIIMILAFGEIWNKYAGEKDRDRLLASREKIYRSSMYARIRDLKEPFKAAKEQPLILITGRGPSKAVLPGSEHSDIGWMTMRYGLGGLICYLMILTATIRHGWRRYRRPFSPMDRVLGLFAILAAVNWFVFMQAESIFKNIQLMSINMLAVGMLFSSGSFQPLPDPRSPRRRRSSKHGTSERPALEEVGREALVCGQSGTADTRIPSPASPTRH